MAKKSGWWKANQGFATTYDGEPLFVQKGELVPDGHPLLKGREELFDRAERLSRFDTVEQATAAPGEKRGRPRHTERAEPTKPAKPAKPEPEKPFGLTTAHITHRKAEDNG